MIFTADVNKVDKNNLYYGVSPALDYGVFIGSSSYPVVIYNATLDRSFTFSLKSSTDDVYFILFRLSITSGVPNYCMVSKSSFSFSVDQDGTTNDYNSRSTDHNGITYYYRAGTTFLGNPNDELVGYDYMNTFSGDGGTDNTHIAWDLAYIIDVGGIEPYEGQDTDPFAPGGTSEPGGGNGTFNGTSDSNPIPGDPTISATDTGFMTVFATNVAGIKALSESLWSDIFSAIQPGGSLEGTVGALKNIVASPYDAILGCHIVPVNVPVGSSRNVKLYGVLPSEVSLPVASSQWVHKDCGSLTIAPYDGSYLDYAPYSKVTSLYLPFVGVVSVDIDIIMNTTIGVYYKIDIVSGQCIVYVTKDNNVYFQYQGQCAVPIPVTSVDWSTTVSSGLGLIGSVTNIVGSAVGGGAKGGAAGALSGAVKKTIGEAGSMAQNVMNSKPDIKAGSGVGGAAALLGCKSPYLIIERPRKSTPKNQNHYTGYPSNIRAKLGTMEGYTEVSQVYVNHMNATTEEKAEIERLLNNGVVFPKRSSN